MKKESQQIAMATTCRLNIKEKLISDVHNYSYASYVKNSMYIGNQCT